ncbi:hypothetical protein Q8A67_008596 [Cirrhinus molitorella]|uniref:Uncharacterized protein n=1 Tax=Cirrhinus molitorella TaxID=172907 RepID=A0AA88Q282_9TELE|nr:hypothetical protein Q8A67_008596 [Cirrhinus molitorella]
MVNQDPEMESFSYDENYSYVYDDELIPICEVDDYRITKGVSYATIFCLSILGNGFLLHLRKPYPAHGHDPRPVHCGSDQELLADTELKTQMFKSCLHWCLDHKLDCLPERFNNCKGFWHFLTAA